MTLLGMLDLSIVTDRLIRMLQDCVDNTQLWKETVGPLSLPKDVTVESSRFTISVTGLPPDAIRNGQGCQLSVYLFHVAPDRFQRNSPLVTQQLSLPPPPPATPTTNRAQAIPAQPLSLDLYYLLTAYSAGSYIQEQQAMSIALKCFHENPIIRSTVTLGVDSASEEFTLTMETESVDELGRVWQAITSSLRLSAVYKVSVVFMTPPGPPALAPQVQVYSVSASPRSLPLAPKGQVMGTVRNVRYTAPGDPQPLQRFFDFSPATAGPGETFLLLGVGFDQPTSAKVFLLAGSNEFDITGWTVAAQRTDTKIPIRLPATYGALPLPGNVPADTPPAGVYQLCVGTGMPGDLNYYRSNTTPFNIAAWVDPTAAPILIPDGSGVFTVAGMGFIAGQTEVLLETIALTQVVGPPSAGQFAVKALSTVEFLPPGGLLTGTYAVRIRVNHIECAPAKWIRVP